MILPDIQYFKHFSVNNNNLILVISNLSQLKTINLPFSNSILLDNNILIQKLKKSNYGEISFKKAWHQVSDKEWFDSVGYKDWSSYKEDEDSAGWPIYGRSRIPEGETRLDGILDSWIESLVDELPVLNIAIEESERISSETIKIKFRVWNSGLLSTDSAMSEKIRESSDVRVNFPKGDSELVLGLPQINLGVLSPGESKSWEWVIKGRKKIEITAIHPRSFINSLTIYPQEIK